MSIPFEEYSNEKLNDRACKCLKKIVKDKLTNELKFIPMYVEKDRNGAWIEDSSKEVEITLYTDEDE